MVVDAVHELLATDVSSCGFAALDRALGLVRRIEGWLASVTAGAAARASELHAAGSGRAPTDTLQGVAGLSKREAHAAMARAITLRASPALADALATAVVSAAHVDAYGQAVVAAPALADRVDELVGVAGRSTPDEFRTHCQRVALLATPPDDAIARFERQRRDTRLRRWVDATSGMFHLAGAFDPETGERVWTAIDREVEARFHDRPPDTAPEDPLARQHHLAALALAALAVGGSGAPGRHAPEVLWLVDHETLMHGLHERSVVEGAHGGAVPVDIARKLACDADVIPVVLGGDGVVLDLGRSKRLATANQRRALRVMYPTCAVPGCTTRFDACKIHHLAFWERDGGRTDLGTQAPLCSGHHTDVHTGRITIELIPDTRAVTVRARDGTVLAQANGPPRRRRS